MSLPTPNFDVLCLGHASYDLVFSVPHHPNSDEKLFADSLLGCGGGPAANAAITVAKLGFKAAFAGYLGQDTYGTHHLKELQDAGVNTDFICRGDSPTPLSAIIVKPDGQRALINYKGDTKPLPAHSIDFAKVSTKTLLFDGHEPQLSLTLLDKLAFKSIPSILDAGSLHVGTQALMDKVSYLVCSEKFALEFANTTNAALSHLAALSPNVVITLGELGLIWQRGQEKGHLPAPPVIAIDTTGAGDAFHGAFAAAIAANMDWLDVLRYASVAGALCCTQMGARLGLPSLQQHSQLMSSWQPDLSAHY